ncbi:MAG: flagellar hook-length control protein FliK [Spirochaetes bacterium]|nr:flagellar hook-length control protein FliK [Spirochaetota bacterium]
MLHLGDNNIAVNRLPDFLDQGTHAVKKNHDIPSTDGFFNVLKNMVQPLDQAAVMFNDRPEPVRDIYSPSLSESEKNVSQPEARGQVKDDVTAAAGRAAEQADKDARLREQDEKAREAQQASQKKEAARHQPKKSADTDSNPSSRLNKKQKEHQAGEPEARDLIEGLHRMIDILRARENGETRHSRTLQGDMKDILKAGRFDRGLLKKQIEGLIAAAEKLSRKMRPENAVRLTRALAGLKQLLAKMKGSQDKNRPAIDTTAADPGLQAVKDILARVESILESARGEGSRQSSGDGQKGGDIFNFSHARSEMPARSAEAALARHQQSAQFREHLDAIIQNARVVVKDGRNASFSVRLNPRELGDLSISLDLSEGVVNGKFMVSSQEAKDMLMGNLDDIRQQLHDAGISVGEFQVNVNDQRGKHLAGDPEHLPVVPAAEQAAEIESRFAPNARALHDGHLDVII